MVFQMTHSQHVRVHESVLSVPAFKQHVTEKSLQGHHSCEHSVADMACNLHSYVYIVLYTKKTIMNCFVQDYLFQDKTSTQKSMTTL